MEKQKKKKETPSTLFPSGALYKKHDNEANAQLIKLNAQDEELLSKCGFGWTPQENHYYKNKKGDTFSFYDTGKAKRRLSRTGLRGTAKIRTMPSLLQYSEFFLLNFSEN